jgi:ribosome-associated heat shock protein Hsp15
LSGRGRREGTFVAAPPPDPARRRLDQWLWFARLAKTRSLAARLCAAGAVELNGKGSADASRAVRVGDLVALPLGADGRRTVRVRALGRRRGPAAEAQPLYEETERSGGGAAAWTPLLGEDGDDEAARH